MKKKYTLVLLLFTVLNVNFIFSQVGIGTTTPTSSLDVEAKFPTGTINPLITDGLLIPRVTRERAQSMTSTPTSTMIYINEVVTGAASGTTINVTSVGFYFYDGAVWQKIATGASTDWALTGNTGTTAGTNFIGTTDAVDFRIKTGGADRWNFSNTNLGQLQPYSLGTALLPIYSFQGDQNTGLFSSGADALDFSTGGTARFRIPNANQVHALSLGTAALPFYSFAADANTGMFSAGADILNIATAGTERIRVEADGDVGIGTTPSASAKLDISATDRGLLIPRVALTAKNAAGPITAPATSLLVYNTATAGVSPNNVIPGYYYWNGAAWVAFTGSNSNDWSITGNSGTTGGTIVAAGSNFIGTTDNQNIDFRTNNTFRGRFSNLGEFFVGTLNTVLTGDLCNAVGNATFPWAVNGYTAFDGAGTYGQVTSGTTIFAGVQGEYNGTNAQGTGVRGIALTATSGTAFTSPHTGVSGTATTGGTYKFGTYGSGGTTTRSGGVLGNDFGIAMGALGYYAFNGLDYSVYGFGQAHTNGLGTGRMSNNFTEKNTHVGIGIYGGVMGGWVRGMKYGFHTKGDTYSLYVDGNGYTNKPLAYLIGPDGQDKVASFMSTSMKPEVTVNGKVTLTNGKVFVAFDRSFQQIIANIDDVIITASPQGKSNGVYIDNITKNGFWIIENIDGVSNIKISWIAITKIKGEENPEVPSDLLAKDFDRKMDGVMFNDNNTVDTPQSLWWDGAKIRWDKPTNDKVDTETEKLARPKEARK